MANERTFEVTESTTLLPFLLSTLQGKGRNKIKALLTHRLVKVGHKIVTRHDHPLRAGETVTIATTSPEEREALLGVQILFEDTDIIVIEKPSGLLSIASETERERTAYRVLTQHVRRDNPLGRIFIVHRLDKDTSGVMMFAKREEIQQALQESWKDTVLERSYVVVVEGQVTPETGKVSTWLKESKTKMMYVSKPGDGVKAVTHYEVLQTNGEFSLLSVKLETGRKNQIRVHMQSIGHPVVGDRRYGAKANPLGRLGLHARVLSFRHPVTSEVMRFETAVPVPFKKLFSQARRK